MEIYGRLRKLDLNLLPSLQVLLTTASVSTAAKHLSLSQSATSGQLARLREIFDDPLLVQQSRGGGMALTPRAVALLDRLRLLLPELHDLLSQQRPYVPARDPREFRIAVLAADTSSLSIATPLIRKAVALTAGAATFTLNALRLDEVERELELGNCDFLLCPPTAIPLRLHSRPLTPDRLVLIQRRNHPRGRKPLTLTQYCGLQHVVSLPRGQSRSQLDDYLATIGVQRRVALRLNCATLGIDVVLTSEFVATVPATVAHTLGHLVEHFELPFAPPLHRVSLAWHPRTHRDLSCLWFRALMPLGAEADATLAEMRE